MKKAQQKTASRARRHARIRARVKGTKERPRLSVFRSNRFMYAQIIDDTVNQTLVSADSREVKAKTPQDKATAVGKEIAKKANTAGIKAVVFDRGGFRYQGAIAALADAAREGGLEF